MILTRHVKHLTTHTMTPENLLIRLSTAELFPRINTSTATPRAADRVQDDLEPVFEEELSRYKQHWDEAFQAVLGRDAPSGEPFPEGDPEFRVTDRIMGSYGIQGASMVEEVPDAHSVVNIAEAVVRDPRFTLHHEFAHTSLSQRGIDMGQKEEEVADAVAEHILGNYHPDY